MRPGKIISDSNDKCAPALIKDDLKSNIRTSTNSSKRQNHRGRSLQALDVCAPLRPPH